MKWYSNYWIGGAVVAVAAFVVACSTIDPVTGERVKNIYSLQDDVQLGQETLRQNTEEMKKANVPINADPARVAQINEIVRRISAVADLPNLPYTVTLYQTNIVNAAAAPGGSMMVFSGLYDSKDGLVEDEDEMAAVLGHEIAHVNCRHVTERLTKITLYAATAEIIAAGPTL